MGRENQKLCNSSSGSCNDSGENLQQKNVYQGTFNMMHWIQVCKSNLIPNIVLQRSSMKVSETMISPSPIHDFIFSATVYFNNGELFVVQQMP
ncbi:hypothetical protein TNCV_3948181 [Trichonephila clavipes]|nr:hypothetical protein TNCV_3948181 [Trichonephila clavipes]